MNSTLDFFEQTGDIVDIPGLTKAAFQFVLQDIGFVLFFGMLFLIAVFIIVTKWARVEK